MTSLALPCKEGRGNARFKGIGGKKAGDTGRGNAGFYEKGYEKTSISDIALKLGVAQGLIYRYFKSKEALFDGALENYAGRLAEQMGEAIRDGRTTLRERL